MEEALVVAFLFLLSILIDLFNLVVINYFTLSAT